MSGGDPVRRAGRGGATILDIWRLLAAQWGLLMVAGMVFMAVTVKREDLLAGEQFRNLIFMLPASGCAAQCTDGGGDSLVGPHCAGAWLRARAN